MDDRLVKKMWLTKGVEYKRKGNEKQHVFNEGVRDKIECTSKVLSATPPAVEKAREALKEGEELITARQKLIRIADRSEYGCNTVAFTQVRMSDQPLEMPTPIYSGS